MRTIDKKDTLWDLFVDDLKAVLKNVDVPVAGWPVNKLLCTDENGNVCTKDPSDVVTPNFGTSSVPGGGDIIFLTDPTLTQDGAAADAKATGDRLSFLENYVTPQMYGAIGDGTTDDTEAIQAMFDDIAGVGKVYFPHGNYLTTSPVIVEQVPDIEMNGVILSNHNGIAFTLGAYGASAFTDKTIKLKIKNHGTKLEEGSVGLVIYSAARNTFYLDTVTNFETNVKLLSEADKGIWFNTFHLKKINSARYGLYLDGSNEGWINDNLFIGGSISVNSDSTGITINGGGSNVFLKQGLEGAGVCVHIIKGNRNSFLKSRCEGATYGLIVDDGRDNVMQSNYSTPEFMNNSRYTTNGIVSSGIRGVCYYPAVSVDRLEDNKFFRCGNKVLPIYCKVIHATSGDITDEFHSNALKFENGAWNATTYRPVFIFDTTKNKKFEFGGKRVPVRIIAYGENGKIYLTDDNFAQYVIADQITQPKIETGFGSNNLLLNASSGFEVSEDVVRIELIYLGDSYDGLEGVSPITGFDIRTEFPCYPIRDEVLTVPQIPSNGYVGVRVIYDGDLYIYNGTEWKREDYALTEEDKTEIAEISASLIDTSLLSALGSGVIE